MVFIGFKVTVCKGYILTVLDFVSMVMMRSFGSKVRALGWLGKLCFIVYRGGAGREGIYIGMVVFGLF